MAEKHKCNLKETRYLIALDKSKISSPPSLIKNNVERNVALWSLVITLPAHNTLNTLNHKTRDTSQVQVLWAERVKFSRKCLTHLPVFLIPEASTFMQFE